MQTRKFGDLLWQKISFVGGGIIIQQTRKLGRGNDGADVCFHFTPITGINIRRQDHQTLRASLLSRFCQSHRFQRAQGSNTQHDRRSPRHSRNARTNNGNLLLETKRRRFSQRTSNDEPGAATVNHPPAMNGERGMVDGEVSREVGRDGGNNTFPIHKRFIFLETAGLSRVGFSKVRRID